jgi:hypothetical protein
MGRLSLPTTFDDRVVMHVRTSASFPFSERSVGEKSKSAAMLSRLAVATRQAIS